MTTPERLDHLHIICYRWGEKYGVEYVNILRAMVDRNLSIAHTFHCICETPDGLHDDIVAHQIPDIGVEGIWRKLGTFQADFLGLSNHEHVVSMDLDIVIVGSLDFLTERPEKPFLIGRNWSRKPGGARASGAVYRLQVGSHAFIWDRFIANPCAAIERFHGKNREVGEQNWLNEHIDEFVHFPDGRIVSFKRHCHAKGRAVFGSFGDSFGLTTANIGTAYPPSDASVVSFHGDPLPPDVMNSRHGRWRRAPFIHEHWRV